MPVEGVPCSCCTCWLTAGAHWLLTASPLLCCPPMQLGVGTTGTLVTNSGIRAGQGTARLQSISCAGTEASWERCQSPVWSNATCSAAGDAVVACSGLESESVLWEGYRQSSAYAGAVVVQTCHTVAALPTRPCSLPAPGQ